MSWMTIAIYIGIIIFMFIYSKLFDKAILKWQDFQIALEAERKKNPKYKQKPLNKEIDVDSKQIFISDTKHLDKNAVTMDDIIASNKEKDKKKQKEIEKQKIEKDYTIKREFNTTNMTELQKKRMVKGLTSTQDIEQQIKAKKEWKDVQKEQQWDWNEKKFKKDKDNTWWFSSLNKVLNDDLSFLETKKEQEKENTWWDISKDKEWIQTNPTTYTYWKNYNISLREKFIKSKAKPIQQDDSFLIEEYDEKLECKPKSQFFTKTEKAFFDLALEFNTYYWQEEFHILSKSRLADIIDAQQNKNIVLWNKVAQKHLDFVFVSRDTFKTKFVVEVNGKSHNTKKQIKSDRTKRTILKNANIPLLVFTNKDVWYNPDGVRATLKQFYSNQTL